MSLSLDVKIKADVTGAKKLEKILKKMNGDVEIGFFDGKIHPTGQSSPTRDTNTIAEVAAINELGLGNSPSRPSMRDTLIENQNYVKALRGLMHLVITGKLTTNQALNKLGEQVADDISEKIANNDFEGNAQRTIKRKGFDDPLTETGVMERDVTHRIKK